MKACACNKYLSPLTTLDEVRERCTASGEILSSLEEIALDVKKWMAVYRCHVCGTLWAQEYPFSEMHGGGTPCLYAIETDAPDAWLKTADDLTSAIRRRHEDKKFYESLGSEIGPELCRHEGCGRRRIAFSVMCRCHHFEMVRQRPCAF
jgi:Immunity protein 27